MNPGHRAAVRTQLANDEGYNQFTLVIFDGFLKGNTAEEIQTELNLDLKSFKLFERNIEKTIFDFYELEDKKVQDLIFSSIFYSLYSSKHESLADRNAELEQLFHSMKQFGIEQAAAPLLKSLYEANINSPLEAVYEHLYSKYANMAKLNQAIYTEFEQFNLFLDDYLRGSNQASQSRILVKQYKKIREMAKLADNNTAKMILQLCKLICIVYCGQDQLLRNDSIGLGELLTSTHQGIENLPFGLDRFYLKNVFQHAYAKHLENVDKKEIARYILKKETESHLFEAYNFNFPNEVSRKYVFTSKPKQVTETANTTVSIPFINNRLNEIRNHSNIDFLRGGLFSNILN